MPSRLWLCTGLILFQLGPGAGVRLRRGAPRAILRCRLHPIRVGATTEEPSAFDQLTGLPGAKAGAAVVDLGSELSPVHLRRGQAHLRRGSRPGSLGPRERLCTVHGEPLAAPLGAGSRSEPAGPPNRPPPPLHKGFENMASLETHKVSSFGFFSHLFIEI